LQEKCAKYWPDQLGPAGAQLFPPFLSVELVSEEVFATFTLRVLHLTHAKARRTQQQQQQHRVVRQYQYTNWPDHGVPSSSLPLLAFVKKSSPAASTKEQSASASGGNPPPIVVHCSAGVGRTGAYIVLETMLRQLRAKGELSILPYLAHIRSQRPYLVQTLDQFRFIHEALAETVLSGETSIKTAYLGRYIASLGTSFTMKEESAGGGAVPFQLLDRQFSHVVRRKPTEAEFSAAIRPANQLKNQSFDFIPLDANRIVLATSNNSDEEDEDDRGSSSSDSDYINASWLAGYASLHEFILTQHPKEQTTADFWRLVWQHRVRLVVVLSAPAEPDFPVFWPPAAAGGEPLLFCDSSAAGGLLVNQVEEGLLSGFQTRDFSLGPSSSPSRTDSAQHHHHHHHHHQHDIKSSNSLVVRLVFCPEWGTGDHSLMLSLINVLHSSSSSVSVSAFSPPPVVVMDRLGGPQAGSLVALSTLVRQADRDGTVDVYGTAKTLHNCRPGIWPSADCLLQLYRVTLTHCAAALGGGGRGRPDGSDLEGGGGCKDRY
jgi:receptor-type tyrosine-protein phosphatase gamma